MKIVNFGSCNIDYVYSLDNIVIPGETRESNSLNIFPGGKGLNQSIAAAKAGAVPEKAEENHNYRNNHTCGGACSCFLCLYCQ